MTRVCTDRVGENRTRRVLEGWQKFNTFRNPKVKVQLGLESDTYFFLAETPFQLLVLTGLIYAWPHKDAIVSDWHNVFDNRRLDFFIASSLFSFSPPWQLVGSVYYNDLRACQQYVMMHIEYFVI